MSRDASDQRPEPAESLAPLLEQAAKSRRVRRAASWAVTAIAGLVASGALTTGAIKAWQWITTREETVQVNTRLAALERAVGLPISEPEAAAESALRIRVAVLERAERDRQESQLAAEDQLFERWVSIAAATAEPQGRLRALRAREAVEAYRANRRDGLRPMPAAERVLESKIPRSTYR